MTSRDGTDLRGRLGSQVVVALRMLLALAVLCGLACDELRATVQERAAAYRRVNGLAQAAKVAVDAVTASGSGLDPHISVANARLQAPRVARELGLPLAEVVRLVERHTEDHLLGEPAVNVLQLNLAVRELDATR